MSWAYGYAMDFEEIFKLYNKGVIQIERKENEDIFQNLLKTFGSGKEYNVDDVELVKNIFNVDLSGIKEKELWGFVEDYYSKLGEIVPSWKFNCEGEELSVCFINDFNYLIGRDLDIESAYYRYNHISEFKDEYEHSNLYNFGTLELPRSLVEEMGNPKLLLQI